MLIEIEPLRQILELTLQAQFLNPFEPTNLLLIAKPESAKTRILKVSSTKSFIYYADEITAKRLIDEVLPMVKEKKIRTLMIPDLLNCVEKQKSTRQQFLMTMKSLIDTTGLTRIETYHKRITHLVGLKASLITAITTTNFKKLERQIKGTGLLSRFIPFSYNYPISKIKKIFEFIETGKEIKQISIKTIKKPFKIPNNRQLFMNFEIVSSNLGLEYNGYGFRIQDSLQRLAKANAFLNDRKTLIQEDINKVLNLSNWINYKFNPL